MPKKLAIIVPAYNAEKTVESVFDRFPKEIRGRVLTYIVVNDGSTDDTAAALRRLQEKFPNCTVFEHEVNKGYGETEKTLLRLALKTKAEVIALIHADGQYAPEELPRLIRPFENDNVDIVQGSRTMKGGALAGGMPLYKFVANRSLSALQNVVLGLRLAEYHSGYMLYSRRALERIPFERLSGSFCYDQEMLIMAKVKGLKVVQVPIPTHYGDEVSHLRPIRYGLSVLSVLWAFSQGHYHAL